MAAIVWGDVLAVCAQSAAQLTAVPDAAQTVILAHVNSTLVTSFFKGGEDSPKLKLARCYLAAHFGMVGPRPTIVTSEGELDLSTSYGLVPWPQNGDPFWLLTGWGVAYQSLVRTTGARLPFVIC